MEHNTREAQEFINEKEAAEIAGLKPATLRRWRCVGVGFPFYRLGVGKKPRVMYKRSEILNWINSFREDPSAE